MAQIKIGNLATDMRLENDWYGIRVLQRMSSFLADFTPFSEQVVVSTPSTLTVREWDAHNSMITLSIQRNIPYGQANQMTITALGTRLRTDGNFQIDPYSGTITGWMNSESAYNAATNTLLVEISKIHEYVSSDSALDVEMNDATALAGSDTITSGNGHDYLLGYGGPDLLASGAGADTLDGGAGNDTMKGGTGNDTYLVDAAGDLVSEYVASGSDKVRASVSHRLGLNLETLILTGADNIAGTGNADNNSIIGNEGDNHIDGRAGNDTMKGGKGRDLYMVDTPSDVVIEYLGEGYDIVRSSSTYTLPGNVETLALTGVKTINGFGNELDNGIFGNDKANLLVGRTGNDTIQGEGGIDTMKGGAGNDTYGVDSDNDVVIEEADAGRDTVISSVSYTLGQNLEDLTLSHYAWDTPGTAVISGTGNAKDNTLIGSPDDNLLDGRRGNDRLWGEQGDDTLVGGLGLDTLTGGWDVDTFLFDTAPTANNVDTITDFWNDTIALDHTTFTAIGTPGDFVVGDERFYAAARAKAGHDADDRVVYDTKSGALYYDADGSGPTPAVQIAVLGTYLGTGALPILTATNLLVV